MTEKKRKVLGISSKTLNVGKKNNINQDDSGRILVVKKNKKRKDDNNTFDPSLLTSQEKERRINVLNLAKQASLAKNNISLEKEEQKDNLSENSPNNESTDFIEQKNEIDSSDQISKKNSSNNIDDQSSILASQNLLTPDVKINDSVKKESSTDLNQENKEKKSCKTVTQSLATRNEVITQNSNIKNLDLLVPKNDLKNVVEREKIDQIKDNYVTSQDSSSETKEKVMNDNNSTKNNKLAEKKVIDREKTLTRHEAKKITLANVQEMMQKNKMKKLDIFVKPKEEEEKEEKKVEVVEDIRKITSKAKQQTFDTGVKNKIVVDKEEKNNKKNNNKNHKQTNNQKRLSSYQVMKMTNEEYLLKANKKKFKKNQDTDSFANTDKIARDVDIPDAITVQELAMRMSEKSSSVIKTLMGLGVMATINQSIDADTAELICTEMGHNFKRVSSSDMIESLLGDEKDDDNSLQERSPVVTVMGHVDHGKTSLLDALRATDVVAEESGGITQHIGAYRVQLKSDKFITFLDTPGHAAFTAMRMRGAKVTDIVVLVVAADDGIKEQTIEAISHAKAANVPIIVAINKIDKPSANIDFVKNSLFSHGLVPDDMGGDTMVIPVSAKDNLNMDKLEEAILLQADLLVLRANPDRKARGHVIEAHIDKGRGIVATFLVEKGTLKIGDVVVVGNTYGKIRSMVDDKNHKLKAAGPSVPIEVTGLNDCPTAGDEFIVLNDEKKAKEIALHRIQQNNDIERSLAVKKTKSLDELFSKAKSGLKELAIVIKADVQGSAEAIVHSLNKLANEEVAPKIILHSVGGISESDVTLAAASKGLVIGFNVRANRLVRDIAKKYGVEIQYYDIIYDLIDGVKKMLGGMLDPIVKEQITGYVEIRKVFNTSRYGKIAGCYVTEGVVKRNSKVRLLRDDIVIHSGKIKSLKRQKDDAKEVKESYECGISFDNFEDIREGDYIEVFQLDSENRSL